MKEDLFDDIISSDVSDEVNELINSIYDIHDLKLYLEIKNDKFKNTKFYVIKSNINYIKLYSHTNRILVTTEFFRLSENIKIDICEEILKASDKINDYDNKEDIIPYSIKDICERIKKILDNSNVPDSYKYSCDRYLNYHKTDLQGNTNSFNTYFFNNVLVITERPNNVENALFDDFELMNDEMFINAILSIMRHYSPSLIYAYNLTYKSLKDKLRKAITKINEKNKD